MTRPIRPTRSDGTERQHDPAPTHNGSGFRPGLASDTEVTAGEHTVADYERMFARWRIYTGTVDDAP